MLRKLTTKRAGFTLVEIMIVVAIIALLAAIAVPGFLRARKRSQASKVLNDLRLISSAMDQYAIETSKKSGDPIEVADWTKYLKKDTNLEVTGHRSVRRALRRSNGGLAAQGRSKSPRRTFRTCATTPSGRLTTKPTVSRLNNEERPFGNGGRSLVFSKVLRTGFRHR